MSTESPPSAAEPRRSTDKRSAAKEADTYAVVDPDRYVSGSKSESGGCLTLEKPWKHIKPVGIRSLLRSKRQRRSEKEEGEKTKGLGESSGYVCWSKRPVPDGGMDPFAKRQKRGPYPLLRRSRAEGDNEQECLNTVVSGDTDETHPMVNSNLKEDMVPCQIFVDVGGSCISMQKELKKTTVKMLGKSAYKRLGANAYDFYCTFAGKCLDEERLLSYYPIERDSTVMVQHRLRAGVRRQTIECRTWDETIDGFPRFHTVALPPYFVDIRNNLAEAKFLSEDIQGFCCQVLSAVSEIHIRNFSLNGNFSSEHILFHKGMVIFDDAVREIGFTPARGRRDYTRVYDIFEPVFRDENEHYPLHADHLLTFLFSCPAHIDLRSPAVIANLTNHSSIQSYTERISTCKILNSMAARLFGNELSRFKNLIGTPDWAPIENVPALAERLMYDAVWSAAENQLVPRYGYDCRECVLLATNYFKHAPNQFHLEIVEAAFSLAMSEQDFLPAMLEALAALNQPLQDPRFDVVKVFGKRVRNP